MTDIGDIAKRFGREGYRHRGDTPDAFAALFQRAIDEAAPAIREKALRDAADWFQQDWVDAEPVLRNEIIDSLRRMADAEQEAEDA